jgi:hypothetical protein
MFEDEMTEEHEARTREEYHAVTDQEKRDEALAQFKSLANGLAGLASAMRQGEL